MSASSIPGANTSVPVPPTQVPEPESSSQAWIAGAVVGLVLGLALVGAGVWLFLRRKKKAVQLPQHGSAFMAPIDPSQPPAGVGGYTDAKPRFHPARPTYYDRPGQLGYPQQGGFSSAPQYSFRSAYNATADPYTGRTHEVKHEGVGGAAELGGYDIGISPGAVPLSELSGVDAGQSGGGHLGTDKSH